MNRIFAKRGAKRWQILNIGLCLLVCMPLIAVLLAWFSDEGESWEHIQKTILADYAGNTLLLMLQVAVYTTVIGVTTAWLTSVTEFKGRKFFSWALILPLACPAYVVAYIYTDLLDYSGPIQSLFRLTLSSNSSSISFPEIRSLSGAAIVLSLVLYPYVYLLSRIAFSERSSTLFDAARSLGASPSRAFYRVALPAARPGIIGGLALVLMETLADYGVVEFFGVPTFSTGIFRTWFSLGDKGAAMKLAAVMLVFVVALVAIEKSSRGRGRKSALSRDGKVNRYQLPPHLQFGAILVCGLPVVLGAILPFTVLLHYAINVGDPLLGHAFFNLVSNSLTVSAVAAIATVSIALLLTYSQQFAAHKTTQISTQFATLGYALPGTMLAVGLLVPITYFDRAIAAFFEDQFGWRTGLILTGTIVTLVFAYVIRFLTVAFNSTSTGLSQIPTIHNQIARTLGANPSQLIYRIHLPLMRRSILTASILVFVDTMRELPATLLLRPFNFETLATRVYRLASDERIAEASTASLLIVVIGLIPVLFLNRVK